MNRIITITITIAILFLGFLGCGSQNKHLSKGKEWIKSDKRHKEARAIAEFKEAIKEAPNNAESHYLLGYYDEDASIEGRGKGMYLAWKNDKKRYLDILIYETLRDRKKETQDSAVGALKLIHKEESILKPLTKALKSKDSKDRYDSALVLTELASPQKGGNPEPIVPELIKLLDHKRLGTRVDSIIALGNIGDSRAVEPLFKVAMKVSEDEDDTESPEARRLAVEALGKLGNAAVDKLLLILQDHGSSMRVDAIESLTKLGSDRAIEPLIAILQEKESQELEVKLK